MSEVLGRNSFLWAYAKWHYAKGSKEFFGVIHNFLWFIADFFSFRFLLKSLFAPWKRMSEQYKGGLDFGAMASAFIVNTLMRIVGLVFRSVVLLVGFVVYVSVVILSVICFLIWIFAPVLFLGCVVLAVIFLSYDF